MNIALQKMAWMITRQSRKQRHETPLRVTFDTWVPEKFMLVDMEKNAVYSFKVLEDGEISMVSSGEILNAQAHSSVEEIDSETARERVRQIMEDEPPGDPSPEDLL